MPAGRVKGEASPRLTPALDPPGREAAAGRGPEGPKKMVIHKG